MKQKNKKNLKNIFVMTKKPIIFLFIMLTIAFVTSCNDKKPQQDNLQDEYPEETVLDSTVYGKCGEGSTMHHLELITDKGDTIGYNYYDEDSIDTKVLGGIHIDDRLAVVGEKGDDGYMYADKIINLTSLLGKWAGLEKSFEIEEGGVVQSDVNENKPYTEWRILNGQLVLSMDTFNIFELGSDSLYLENKEGIYGYKRLTKDQ